MMIARTFVAVAFFLFLTGSANARVLTLTVVVPNPQIAVFDGNTKTPFSAATATFSASYDDSAIHVAGGGSFQVNAPITISIPGLPDALIPVSMGALVITSNIDHSEGQVELIWLVAPLTYQGVMAAGPALHNFSLANSVGTYSVETLSLPISGHVTFGLPDGRSVDLAANLAVGSLALTNPPPAPIPLLDRSLVLLLSACLAAGAFIEIQRRRRRPGPWTQGTRDL